MNKEQFEFLKGHCNKLENGLCSTLNCLKRGGLRKGEKPDYSLATCVPLEITKEFERLEEEICMLEAGENW